jgi:hypothetical protein
MLKIKGLFSEDGESFSIGRLSFWGILGISIYFWFALPVIAFPPSLLHMLYLTTGYNIAKKGINTITSVKEKGE